MYCDNYPEFPDLNGIAAGHPEIQVCPNGDIIDIEQ